MFSRKDIISDLPKFEYDQDWKYPFADTPDSIKDDVGLEKDTLDELSDNAESKDAQLTQAVEKVKQTGDMIHIIKQELKCQILYKRFKQGKNDVNMEVPPPKDYKLRPEEVNKIIRRREQNRKAAQRCRLRKKNKMEELEDVRRHMLQERLSNEKIINRLTRENNELRVMLQYYNCAMMNSGTNFTYQHM